MTGQHLYLCGLRGSGKTTVGGLLGSQLELPVFDSDRMVEADAGRSIQEIFEEGGEQVFRDYETVALSTTALGPQAVISLGGGAIVREKNRQLIGESGRVVWLTAAAETLVERCREDDSNAEQRPSLTGLSESEEMKKLMSDRTPFFKEIADHVVETDGKTAEVVAAEVAAWWAEQSSGPDS